MKRATQHTYEKLLANDRFLLWASGKNESDANYWQQWLKNHPGEADAFEHAHIMARTLRFKPSDISSSEIGQRWDYTKSQMKTKQIKLPSSSATFWYYRIAGVLIIPLLIFSAWFYYSQQNLRSELDQFSEYMQKKAIHVEAPLGSQIEIELPDGTKAWLNSGSEIDYPNYFESGDREVQISGEVYFQVSKSKKPFLVKSVGPTIKVYGTEFNVHAYPEDNNVIVALAEGRISLDENGNEIMMNPGEVAVFDKSTLKLEKKESDIYVHTCWREDKYIFRDAPLGAIIRTLERRYNVSITLKDPEMSRFTYNATFTGEPLEQILELMTFTAPLAYKYHKQELKQDGSYSKAEVILWKDDNRMKLK